MKINQIFRTDCNVLPLVRKIEKLATLKKMTFSEAVIFCLKGASTQTKRDVKQAQNSLFSCPKGGSTRSEASEKKGGAA